jgi:hypothetical protein
MEEVFTDIYENNLWGNDYNDYYKGSSGGGSEINYNKDTYIPLLRNFIIENNIQTVVDLGCGDFKCGKMIYDDLDIYYTGYDAYKKMIDFHLTQYSLPKYNFINLDVCNKKEYIINGDLCILKDVMQHWSLRNIYEFLDYVVYNKKFKYILITNCCNQESDNIDINNGGFRKLSCNFLPLKKYNAKKLYNYDSKEVSVIKIFP